MSGKQRRRFPGWRGERADWVIAGWTNPDGTVCVIASTKLVGSELQHRARTYEFLDVDDMRVNLKPETTLAVHMADHVFVQAADYPTAMAELFRQWRPEMADRPALGSAARVLTPPAAVAEREARVIQQMTTGGGDVVDAEVIDETGDGPR